MTSSAWSPFYERLVNRNLGLLTREQQEKLKGSCVAVCGLGGVGGVVAEILARTGIEKFKLLDEGKFEGTNSNRQIFSFQETEGRLKVDVTEEFLKKINPALSTHKYLNISEANLDEFLEGVDVLVLGIDALIPILLLSRGARNKKIPLIEGWAIAFGNVRVFTHETPTVEEVYNLPTKDRTVSSITQEEAIEWGLQCIFSTVMHIEGLKDYYTDSSIQRMQTRGEGTTFAPLIWVTDALMALETIKVLLNWGRLALAPAYALYDPIDHKIPQQITQMKLMNYTKKAQG